jgi:hypothetical protein
MKSLVLPLQVKKMKGTGCKRRIASWYFMILRKMKIAENKEQRFGIAWYVGQLSFNNTMAFVPRRVCMRCHFLQHN